MRIAPLVCLVAVAGCTHQRRLTHVGELANMDELEVTGNDGRTDDVEGFAERGGEYALRTEGGGIIQYADIKQVVEIRRGRGALEGFGIGALIGGGTGIILGLASGDDTCENEGHCWFTLSAEGKAILGGIFLGGTAGLLGLVVGAMRGSRFVYSTDGGQSSPRFVPHGPPGSQVGATFRF